MIFLLFFFNCLFLSVAMTGCGKKGDRKSAASVSAKNPSAAPPPSQPVAAAPAPEPAKNPFTAATQEKTESPPERPELMSNMGSVMKMTADKDKQASKEKETSKKSAKEASKKKSEKSKKKSEKAASKKAEKEKSKKSEKKKSAEKDASKKKLVEKTAVEKSAEVAKSAEKAKEAPKPPPAAPPKPAPPASPKTAAPAPAAAPKPPAAPVKTEAPAPTTAAPKPAATAAPAKPEVKPEVKPEAKPAPTATVKPGAQIPVGILKRGSAEQPRTDETKIDDPSKEKVSKEKVEENKEEGAPKPQSALTAKKGAPAGPATVTPAPPVETKDKAGAPANGNKLIMSPMTLSWTDKGGQQMIIVKNPATTPMALKVKCSDNKLFSINPVFTIIPPGKSVNIVVTRTPGAVKNDKVVMCYAPCTDADGKDLAVFFKKAGLPSVNVDVPMGGGAAPKPALPQSDVRV